MSRYRANKSEIRALQRKASLLALKERTCQEENRFLQLTAFLLRSWCDGLGLLQCCLAASAGADDTSKASQLEELVKQELQLLQELAGTQDAACSSHHQLGPAEADAAGLAEVRTLAPLSDPMAAFRDHVLRAPLPEAATMTPLDLAKVLRGITLEVSVRLHLLQTLPPAAHGPPLQRLEELWDRYIHAMVSCVMVGRPDVVDTINIINMDTLELDPEGAKQQDERIGSLVPQLGLTQRQVDTISAVVHLWQRLSAPIRQERLLLQAMPVFGANSGAAGSGAAAAVAASSGGGEGAGAGSGGHSSGSSSSSSKARGSGSDGPGGSDMGSSNGSSLPGTLSDWQLQQTAMQEHLARLQVLLQKEWLMRLAAVGTFFGCLSVQQLSTAAVRSWPYLWRPMLLAQKIHQQHPQAWAEQPLQEAQQLSEQ